MKPNFTLVLNLASVCLLLLQLPTLAINSLVISQTNPSNNKSNEEISSIGKKITVQIFRVGSQKEQEFVGTGFIVKKENKSYRVLTNYHVVKKIQNQYKYQVKTYDDKIYATSLPKQLDNYDLAILTFPSSVGYETAKLGNSQALQPQDKVFVVGFPCASIPCKPKFTMKSGVIAPIYFLLQGKTLAQGYSIGYDIDVQPGTSGGPIIDSTGEVVGVNGRSKYVESPFANATDTYTFTDNTQPDENIKLLMTYFAWGIPIETYINFNNDTNLKTENTHEYYSRNNTIRTSQTDAKNQRNGENLQLIIIRIVIIVVGLFIFSGFILILRYVLNEKKKEKNQQRPQARQYQHKKRKYKLLKKLVSRAIRKLIRQLSLKNVTQQRKTLAVQEKTEEQTPKNTSPTEEEKK